MIINFLENLVENLNFFDLFVFLIFIFFIVQCFLKGFSLSLISFMKWIISTIITIILVPRLQPIVSEYIESQFINSFGPRNSNIHFFVIFNNINWKNIK